MTTNQTIDGVPRELIEYAVALIEKAGQRGNVSIELRALLDAPEPVKANRLGTHHVLGAIHNVPGFPGVKGNHIHDLTALLNGVLGEPSAQSQGEPAAIIERARKIEQLRGAFEQRFKLDIWPVIDWLRNSGLYAEQPAPVAVVMPDRKKHVHQGLSHTDAKADGWNACLNELKRLNPSL